ncbi:MAG: hypothetical protein IMF11_04485 [Proteobacteria bacterium]|nr:hypothetical protein [Pseudomonadota bacterium]
MDHSKDAEKIEMGSTMCCNVLVALDSGKYDRLVVLVGNIHCIKHIVWAPEVSHNRQYLAGRLIQEGVKVFTVMQDWDEETEKPRLISASTPQGLALAMKVIDPLLTMRLKLLEAMLLMPSYYGPSEVVWRIRSCPRQLSSCFFWKKIDFHAQSSSYDLWRNDHE